MCFRGYKPLFLIVLLILFMLGGCGNGQETPTEPAPGADSEDAVETVGLFAAGDFENPQNCAGCHSEIYEAWSGSLHAHAWTNDLFQVEYVMAHHDTDGLTDVFCAGCHTPIGVAVGQVPPYDGSMLDDTSVQGISCDYCHTVSAVKDTKNAMTVKDPGPVKRGPRDDAVSPAHEVMYSEVHLSAEFCGACHNVNHPLNDLPLETTYTEWEMSPYAAEGITCQNCHMTPDPGIGVNPGKSAGMGPEREHIATHHFVGGGAFMFNNVGSEKHAAMAEERLQAAAELAVRPQFEGEKLQLAVDVTNVAAGHMLPTGLTNVRKMWLEVTVSDAAGEIIYQSGQLLEGNHIDPDAVFFHTIFGDGTGKKTDEVWLAAEVLFDRRIAPRETYTHNYSVDTAQGSAAGKGSYDVEVRLLYRSAPQYLADKLFGEGALPLHSVEMARTVMQVQE